MTKLTATTGLKTAGHLLTQILTDESLKEKKWTDFLTNQAKLMSLELGELKGSLMKAGQMISMYGELFLPPEANEFLRTLQAQSPPLLFSEIEKVIIENLKEKYSLLEVDPNPIGSASLGQVHKAKIKQTGEWIALKVQYPGVDKAIASDLKAIRSLFSMLSLLPSEFQTDTMFREIQTMLEQEVDYEQEARHTLDYRQKFGDDPRYVIPKLYPEFCAKKVIATSFEPGLSVSDPLISALSQERRNRLSENFLDLYFRELFQFGFIQTDPHLGNYKIRLSADGKDQLVLLDFGAVRQYEPVFLKAYRQMIKSALMQDQAQLEQASLDLKFIEGDDAQELKTIFKEFCEMTVEPFLDPKDPRTQKQFMTADGIYDWKASDLPKRLTSKAIKIIRDFPLRTPPSEVVFLDRKTGGVFIFLNVLGAKIRAREIIMKYFNRE